MQRQTEALADLLAAGPALVVSGAGISTDSGIPDYRDADGRMRHASPMTYQQFVASAADRRRYWARSHLGWHRIAAARPNAGHLAVAALQAAGRLSGVVTQNVDGLHTAAGTDGVIDLHGRLDTVVCLDCGVRRPRLELGLRLDAVNPGFRTGPAGRAASHRPDGDVVIPEDVVARFRVVGCRGCGGVLKPDVVFFGEHVPSARFRAALDLLDRSASLLVLGSSLMVGSGYRFVTAAVRRGLPVAIATRGTTRGDRHAGLKVDAALGEVLPALAAEAAGRTGRQAHAAALAG
ncbi:MAG TPA: NAD-dependent protein deacetylase [Egicoccus sp.]|nr:NAD-dependent protein deacetylase [Egicoccus sp.]HSK23719.1 NAD-dependent protein deacetylase [Egicoccus sp.]